MAQQFRDTKAYDLLAASPLIAFYLFAAAGIVIRVAPEIARVAHHFDARAAFDAASQLLAMIFLGVQIALFIMRRVPMARAHGLIPNAAAIIGANLGVLFLRLPPAHNPPALEILSTALTFVGTLGAIIVVSWLRDAFAILPQARVLVTSGPYAYVRHPLYLVEIVATVGVALQFAQPLSGVVLAAVVAMQFARMHFEEQVLLGAFPEYAAYRARTARLIPGIY